jgi:hypothetical protein
MPPAIGRNPKTLYTDLRCSVDSMNDRAEQDQLKQGTYAAMSDGPPVHSPVSNHGQDLKQKL